MRPETHHNVRESIQDEIKRLQLITFCTEQINRFPDNEVDEEVMVQLLELVGLAASGSKSLTKYIAEGGALNKIAVQLSIVLEELNSSTHNLQGNQLRI